MTTIPSGARSTSPRRASPRARCDLSIARTVIHIAAFVAVVLVLVFEERRRAWKRDDEARTRAGDSLLARLDGDRPPENGDDSVHHREAEAHACIRRTRRKKGLEDARDVL